MTTFKLLQSKFQILSIVFILAFGILGTNSYAQSTNTNTANEQAKRKIQIALILDTSGSMDGLIEQAKTQLWNLVDQLTKATYNGQDPQLEIALYEYGNDRLRSESGYIKQISPLTTDLDDISASLFAMSTNGGSEFCGLVIKKAQEQLEWSNSDKDIKVVFIAGNEPFTQGKYNYERACGNARAKGIIINTIHCGDYNTGVIGKWKSGAIIGGGDYMAIEQNKRTIFVETPFDDQINDYGKELNKTYVYYGKEGKRKKAVQETEDANAESYSKSNLTRRNSIKASKYYKAERWDLVEAYSNNKIEIKDVKRSTLPKRIQTLSDSQLKAYVITMAARRKIVKTKIAELNIKRNNYIKQKNTDQDVVSLESSMVKSIKKQAKRKNYSF